MRHAHDLPDIGSFWWQFVIIRIVFHIFATPFNRYQIITNFKMLTISLWLSQCKDFRSTFR